MNGNFMAVLNTNHPDSARVAAMLYKHGAPEESIQWVDAPVKIDMRGKAHITPGGAMGGFERRMSIGPRSWNDLRDHLTPFPGPRFNLARFRCAQGET
jgi:hypothetical protein